MEQNGYYNGATTLRRNRTLIRPDREIQEAQMLSGKETKTGPWVIFSRIVTFLIPSFLLSKLGGLKTPEIRQAWREKVALCFIIAVICGIILFLTLFLSTVFCPNSVSGTQDNVVMIGKEAGSVGVLGKGYSTNAANWPAEFKPTPGQDITPYFFRPIPSECLPTDIQQFRAVSYDLCTINNGINGCVLGALPDAIQQINLEPLNDRPIGFDWSDLDYGYFVINGIVVNLNQYLISVGENSTDLLDQAIFAAARNRHSDGTILFTRNKELLAASKCLISRYRSGVISKQTVGCFGVALYNYVALIIIMLIVFIRFTMALVFKYFISWKLVKRPPKEKIRPISYNAAAPWSSKQGGPSDKKSKSKAELDELYTVLLVTCYSEGEDSIKGTCDSLCLTDYSNSRKLLFMVADGILKGSGNDRTTSDICIGLIEQEEMFLDPESVSYIAVASGSKQYNEAKVYCGYYRVDDVKVPAIVVVKCGGPLEKDAAKPGNRGKRDSQVILMGFFSRVIYNDRLCPLDYDLFRKVHHLTGATPDLFEIVLMVDADTRVYPDSLRLLVNCLNNDQLIMGICGETRIANKRQSWVTAIQVYEYYISHHLGKAFESVFGGVTCLPGCFCMYRLKAQKGTDWVPVLTKPEILQDYSQNVVETLHEKNLLLLGEDRFLTTLMLKNFPNRKMMFMPQAVCKTVVPDEFKVLLSQRRRWINSTVHNLMELLLVRNLCGTFCLSMQFSIFLDLIGTVVLPVAIFMTYVLIIQVFRSTYNKFSDYLPLIMLLIVLFLPSTLIAFTSRRYVYFMWMLVYLIALPVWNFILPTYAYWHFDDFSWGETRKVAGETKDTGHGNEGGNFDSSTVPLRRWEDYERRRIRSMRNLEKSKFYSQNPEDQYNSSTYLNESESVGLLQNGSNGPNFGMAYDAPADDSSYQDVNYNYNDYSNNNSRPSRNQVIQNEFELQTFNSNPEVDSYYSNDNFAGSNNNQYQNIPQDQDSRPTSPRIRPAGGRELRR
ncbi:Chitin synthase 7 [Smittium mucronatum]|uniref:chitin synthase n=1 Tax=Smittium mucronatum TaxID=133383 RepID=A0A1R0GXB4_9FUNG|nr:Chitin synthase 7 [Smittium mucronatum]